MLVFDFYSLFVYTDMLDSIHRKCHSTTVVVIVKAGFVFWHLISHLFHQHKLFICVDMCSFFERCSVCLVKGRLMRLETCSQIFLAFIYIILKGCVSVSQ